MVIENHFLQLVLVLVIILPAAKLAGWVAVQLGQPSVLGKLLIGVLLGPSLLNILHAPIFGGNEILPETIKELGELGVLMLMFIAGLELDISEMRQSGKVSVLAGTLGVVAPVLLGWGAGILFGLSHPAAIFLGLTLGATSVSISAQTLMEMNVLRSKVGLGLLGAAVFDDMLVILLLSIFTGLVSGGGSALDIMLVIVKMVGYLALALAFGRFLLPPILNWVKHLPISQNTLSLAVFIMLAFGLLAELLGGMAAITGAFLAGLMFSQTSERDNIMSRISAVAYGFFVPIFFINIGLNTDLRTVGSALGLAGVVILVAIIGKLIGAGLGARLSGFSWLESTQLGTGMISRGEVGLILAAIGEKIGVMDQATFAAIVAMIVVTTLITPLALRLTFNDAITRLFTKPLPVQEKPA